MPVQDPNLSKGPPTQARNTLVSNFCCNEEVVEGFCGGSVAEDAAGRVLS
jgi:hypothetical protein